MNTITRNFAVLAGILGVVGGAVAMPGDNSSVARSTLDTPYALAQATSILPAQAATAGAGSTPHNYLLTVCKEIESTGNPRSAGRAVDPAYMLKNLLYSYSNGKQFADLVAIKTTLLEGTAHGIIISGNTNDNGRTVYRYDPVPNYVGKDKAVFMAEFEGKRYKIVVNLVVSLTVGESPLMSDETPVCPPPQLIKVKDKPMSISLGFELNAVPVTFANLSGGVLGQTTRSNIALAPNAAEYNWFIEATPGGTSDLPK